MALAVLGLPAQATDISQLDEVLVQASRDQSTLAGSKHSAAVVTRQQLDEQQPVSVAEAFKYHPNIDIGGGPRSSNQQPVIRGLDGNRVLQLVDGARQNFVAGHRGTYQVDPELLKQVDVIVGPAGSLWGSGAIGGVVAQTTRSGRELLREGQSLGGYITQSHGTAAEQHRTSAALYGAGEQLDLLLNGYYRDQHDTRLGSDSKLSYSAERERGGLIKLGWQLDDAQRLTLSHRQSETTGAVPGNPEANVGSSSPLVERESADRGSVLGYRLDPDSGLVDLELTLYHNRTEVDEYRVAKNQRDHTDYRTQGLSLVNRSQLDWGKLTYGVDGYQDKSQGSREGANRPTPADGRSDVIGSFVQAEVPLGDAWLLLPALRYDHFSTEAKNLAGSKRSESELSTSLALSWQATDWLELIARYDEAFRAPTSEELYTSGTHFSLGPMGNNVFVPNPDLRPEKAASKELIVRAGFDDVLADNDSLRLSASLFRNDVDDFIEQKVIMDFRNSVFETRYDNVRKAVLRGGELNLDYAWQDLELGLSYGRTAGKDKHTGADLEGIPADKWVARTDYWLFDSQLKLGARLTYAGSVHFEDRAYDSYTLLDLGARWYAEGALSGLELGVTVDNLTDRYYRRAFNELYEPGRNIKLNALYRF
ncbi:TonB-dependent hemoglobin/transferrin/lactoferrin family receptor [Oceanimonas baumannii]|uniref:TonB-dependent hemoglobin/transferrin/lactoferrin family receptor n=1 Tax=Oceanimonas baumannii TaxID=129578 RepID=UPI001D1912C2|nr:TonB-dependent hemoglobin/transferrin/lactoferrin family receptor [Oceanimonas baumannii]MCC4263267.1 TonB-dependent hemoglobin/transferrin/lactoferrin family receptor [Oceanimonas baumannii]